MRYDTQQDYDDRQRDAEDVPEAEHTADVEAEAEHTPEADAEHTPEADAEHTPEADAEHTPEANVEHTPEANVERAPETELTPEDEPEPEPEPVVATAPVPPPAVTATDVDTAALWPEETVHDIQQRFREVQWRFVDDPRAAADEAHALVTESLDQFSATIESRKRELDGWRDTDAGDTEQMRMVVRRYRNLLDRLLGV